MQRTPLFIGIILTNGVSFSLVAGACCVIKYNNDPTSGGTAGSGQQNNFGTMNINSTGAKTVKSSSNGLYSTNYYIYHGNHTYLFVYDGTYYNAMTVYVRSYTDN